MGKGGSEQRAATSFPRDPRDPGMNSKSRILYMFLQQKLLGPHSGAMFFYFPYPSHLKHIFLIVVLEDGLPEMLSKLGVLAERGIKKSKKHHAIAPIAKTPRKVPGREHIDCENTMNMNIENRKSKFDCVFFVVCVADFSFHFVLR